MNDILLSYIEQRYKELNAVLEDCLKACQMGPTEEREELVKSIKERTNHNGLHYSALELTRIFLGSEPLTW